MHKNLARTFRKNMQYPEKILWYHLRNRRFIGYKFRRQVPVDNYIADFLCYEARLIIELDGSQHLTNEMIAYDKERTEYLEGQYFRVLRFFNTEILNQIDTVLEKIYQELKTPSSELRSASPVEGEAINSYALCGKEYQEQTGEVTNKQQLRKWAKEERKKLDVENLSKVFVQKLQETKEYSQAQNIMLFYPLKDEINLLPLIKDKSKRFYLPRIEGDNLCCCPYCEADELCESVFKTKEPLTEPVQKSLIDLIIVPALAVDKNNYRLGYGGGFYDRFLKDVSAIKLTCISKKMIVATVYPEKHDILIDKIITA